MAANAFFRIFFPIPPIILSVYALGTHITSSIIVSQLFDNALKEHLRCKLATLRITEKKNFLA